jgi:hypothetical protein
VQSSIDSYSSSGISSRGGINKKLILLVFSFFLLVNIISSGAHIDWWDGTETFLVTESMALKHSAKLYPDIPSVNSLHFNVLYTLNTNKILQTGKNTSPFEPVYTLRSILLSAIAVPFYYAATIFSASPVAVVGLFVNSLIISLTSLVIFCFSFEVYGSRKISFVLGLIYAVCSFVWPYNTSLWPQPLQALTLIASAFFIYISVHRASFPIASPGSSSNNNEVDDSSRDRANSKGFFAVLGALFAGMSVLAQPTSMVLIPGFLAYGIISTRHYKKALVLFVVALVTTLLFVGLLNYVRFGSFTSFGYGYYSSLAAHNGWKGLIGLFASPGAGLIFYFPIAIILPLAFKYVYRKSKPLFFLSIYVIIINWLDIGTLSWGFEPYAWSGAIAWGPRYLIPVIPFLAIVLGSLFQNFNFMESRKKRLSLKLFACILCAAGFFVNLMGKLIWMNYGLIYGWQVEKLAKYVNNMDIMTWNPYYSPIIIHTKAFLSGFVSTLHPELYVHSFWAWVGYGLAPCPVDVYVFCKLGIAPTILLGAAIAILAAIIITGKDLHISNNKVRSNFLPTINLENFDKIRKITGNVFSRTSSSISRDQK